MTPDWIPQPWNLLLPAVGAAVWWLLRKMAKDQRTLSLAQKALDLLAWFLKQGQPLSVAVDRAAAELARRENLKRETADRIVAGARTKLPPDLLHG